MEKKFSRKETKSSIPRLEDCDRTIVLPVIIKLLKSKIIQKKGVIN